MTLSLDNPAFMEDDQPRPPVAYAHWRSFRDYWLLVFVVIGFLFELGLWFLGDTALRLPLPSACM